MARLTFTDVIRVRGRLAALTGLEPDEFQSLLTVFSPVVDRQRQKATLEGNVRQRKREIAAANASLPSHADQLLFVLIFLKQNLSQEMLATLFDMSQNKVHYWLYALLPMLKEALSCSGDLPARSKEAFLQLWEEDTSPLFVTTV